MFHLEKAIAEWRQQMLAAGIESPALIDELEGHLREAIEQQVWSGVDAQEAFEVSSRQFGSAKAVGTEFKKTSSFRERFEKWGARFAMACSAAAGCFVMAMGARAVLSAEMSGMCRLAGLAAVATSLMAIFGGPFLKRFFPVLPERRMRQKVQFACLLPAVVWFAFFTQVVLPNLDFERSNVPRYGVMVLWTLTLLPVSFRLWKGFDDAATSQFSKAR